MRVATGAVTALHATQALGVAGYKATAQEALLEDQPTPHSARDAVIAGLLTLPVFVVEMGGHLVPAVHHWITMAIGQQTSWLIQMVLVLAVLIWPGRGLMTSGFRALAAGHPNMNSLVAIGAGAAFLYSLLVTLFPAVVPDQARAVYFESAAVIVTLILLGRHLEERAKGQAGAALRALMNLQPQMATRVRDGVHEVPIGDIDVGDVLLVRPGERVPTDGEIVEGAGWIDESMLTGEPLPVHKTLGAQITGGTVNGESSFQFRATQVGKATRLAQILRMVEEAQSIKPPVQALVDRITLWFVPAVMGLAVVTVLLWLAFVGADGLSQALAAGVSVLIVACPCAMGLATPTSILVGTGRAGELGILFRKGTALQSLSGVKSVAFDKTGTLTEGAPRVIRVLPAAGFNADEVLLLAAAVEARSAHPLAKAIREAPGVKPLPEVADFTSETGRGVSGMVSGHEVYVGSQAFLATTGVKADDAFRDMEQDAPAGQVVAFVAVDQKLAAAIVMSDPLKPSAAEAVRELQSSGLEVALLSGDRQATAEALGRSIGIMNIQAQLTPDQKLQSVRTLQRNGAVAFVGDGMNDGPALAAADVSVAIGAGSDVAIEAADVVLMSDDPQRVATAISLSRATLGNIRQNLFWAFAYNVLLIPVAAGALYPINGMQLSPMLAAGAMALSSLFVVGNALRLRRFAQSEQRDAGIMLGEMGEARIGKEPPLAKY
jgi:Cu+-exporting ATPase